MIKGARYGHTNLVANDWRALAKFYQEVFGCVPVSQVGQPHRSRLKESSSNRQMSRQ